jgi:hypothetical protein
MQRPVMGVSDQFPVDGPLGTLLFSAQVALEAL